jgi:diaminohydroxyphosphoribosylaminopyrimidine deaminase/5-amino-6-(5-phosphoribosylamino)uracil reductase
MRLAIDEGKKGLGRVAPNPPVGCVILDSSGHWISQGHHRVYGGDHAEIDALKNIKDLKQLEGATVYVTLEPCAHEGKTPSCAKKLATLPIRKVVYGLLDPNPLVAGQGLEILRQAGIEVELSRGLENELEQLPEHFLWNQREKKTFVSLKVATSLDGQLAHVSGESRWITGERAREEAHYLRAQHDAVLVGKETFLKDDPSLNIRHPLFSDLKNKAIVLDSKGEAFARLAGSRLAQAHQARHIIFVVGASQKNAKSWPSQGDEACGAIWFCREDDKGQIDLTDFLRMAFEYKILSILVEGGAQIISSFLKKKLAQRYYQFIAPQIVGGRSGTAVTDSLDLGAWSERLKLECPRYDQLGTDILVTGRLTPFLQESH